MLRNTLLATCLMIIASMSSFAQQQFPIETTILLSPPYPSNLDAYLDFLEQGIVEVNNTTNDPIDVYFSILLEETSGKIRLDSDGPVPISLECPSGIFLLSPSDIQDVFGSLTEGDFKTAGLSPAERDAILLNRQLPEGNYRICIQAFDEIGTPLSDMAMGGGCTDFSVFFAERPIIDSPYNDEVVDSIGDFLVPTWSHTLSDIDAQLRTEYILKIIDVTEQSVTNIQNAMLDPGVSAEYEENLGTAHTATLQNDVELPLIVGHRYAMRVTAVDPEDQIAYKYGGHSEVIEFQYGDLIDISEEDTDVETGGNNNMTAPIVITPESGNILIRETPLAIPLEWSHEVEDSTLKTMLTYRVKVVDLDSLDINNVLLSDFTNDNYDYIWNKDLDVDFESDTSMQVLLSDDSHQLQQNHNYALVIYVESDDDRISMENDGYSEIIRFQIGKSEDEVDEEEGCGGNCLATLPSDKDGVPIKKNDKLIMGNLMLIVDDVEEDDAGGYSGTGSILVSFIQQIRIKVKFNELQANKKKQVFAGVAKAVYDESIVKADGIIAAGASSIMKVDFDAASALSSGLRSAGKLASALSGKETTLPLGFDRSVNGDTMVVGITEMDFTPTKATMSALFSLTNPDWGDYIPTMGATNICFRQNGFGQVVKLYLGEDYDISMGNDLLKLKASESNQPDQKGTYCTIDCNGFKEGQITAELGIPREVLLPENEDGSIQEEGLAKLTLNGLYTKGSGFMLSASMSPCQIPGLEGFSVEMENGYYDASDEANPVGITFPEGYTIAATDNQWKGIWFSNMMIKAPADWGGADSEERTSVGIENFIKDDVGISVVGSANNLLGIEKGSIEGFAISIDKIQMDIIRGEFKEVKVEGRMGLPILNEDDYLTYEGIVDRNEKEDGNENKEIGAAEAAKNIANANNNTNAASESLSMRFTVNANEEGYDLDWIKSHVVFEENTQILLENSNKRRGIEAQLSGNITLNSSMDSINVNRDSGLPDIDLPGLKFEGMEISKMKDKTKNGPIAGGFQFVKPTFSFMGVNLSDATDGLDLGGLPDDPEQEQIKDVDPKVNGFSLGITNMDLSFGEIGSSEEVSQISDGTAVNLSIVGEVSLVRGKKGSAPKKNEGLAISAKGGFTLSAKAKINGTKTIISYDKFAMDSLTIDAQVSVMGIKGKLAFYNKHEKFGDGAVGSINLELPMINARIDGRFGSVEDYSYWYLFGNVRGGTPDNPKPFATFYNLLSIYGFNGGAYYHMTNTGKGAPETRFVPNESTVLGLQAGLTVSITDPKVLWGNLTLGAEFNDDAGVKLTLDGSAYMLKSEMIEREENEEIEGVEAKVSAQLNIKADEFPSLTANMQIFANVAKGVLIGNMKGKPKYQMVDATLDLNKDTWKLFMGTPDNRASVKIGIPDTDIGVTAKAYLMLGNVPLPEANLPPKIQEMLSGSITQYSEESSFSGGTGTIAPTRNNGGFAIGASLEYNLNAKASILYADFYAGFGFDLSIVNKPSTVCTNNGGRTIGINGWYSSGQVYAGISGDIGLDIDIWAYTGKISLAKMSAVMALKGGFPNPIYAKGRARMSYSVLAGLVSGSTSFGIDLGKKCEEDITDPFAGLEFIASISPKSRTQSVSPYVQPFVSLNQRLGEYYFYTTNDDKKRKEHRFKIEIDYVKVNGKITDWEKSGNLEYVIRPTLELPEKTSNKVEIKLKGTRYQNGEWVVLKDKDGGVWHQEESVTFDTGPYPDKITMNNVTITYPFRNERNYIHGENILKFGLIKMHYTPRGIFEQKSKPTAEWIDQVKVKIYKGNKLIKSSVFHDKEGNVIEYPMPKILDKNSVYQIKVVRTYSKNPQFKNDAENVASYTKTQLNLAKDNLQNTYTIKKEGKIYSNFNSKSPPDKILFQYSFATSKYATFKDKINDKYIHKLELIGSSAFDRRLIYEMENGEGFGKSETVQYIPESKTVNKGRITAKLRLSNNYYNYVLDDFIPKYRDYQEHYDWLLRTPDRLRQLRNNPSKGIAVVEETLDSRDFGKFAAVFEQLLEITGRQYDAYLFTTRDPKFRKMISESNYKFSSLNSDYLYNISYSEKQSGNKTIKARKGQMRSMFPAFVDDHDLKMFEAINNYYPYGLGFRIYNKSETRNRFDGWASTYKNWNWLIDPTDKHWNNEVHIMDITYNIPLNPKWRIGEQYSKKYNVHFKK